MRKRLWYWWMKLGDGMHAVNSFVLLTPLLLAAADTAGPIAAAAGP